MNLSFSRVNCPKFMYHVAGVYVSSRYSTNRKGIFEPRNLVNGGPRLLLKAESPERAHSPHDSPRYTTTVRVFARPLTS